MCPFQKNLYLKLSLVGHISADLRFSQIFSILMFTFNLYPWIAKSPRMQGFYDRIMLGVPKKGYLSTFASLNMSYQAFLVPSGVKKHRNFRPFLLYFCPIFQCQALFWYKRAHMYMLKHMLF